MLITIDAPYADTTAADLSFALGLPEQPALHVLDLDVPGVPDGALRLRLLGASHQVVLRAAATELVETVACLPGRAPELPSTVHERATGYRFAATVHRLHPDEISARAAVLRRALAADPYALVGVFPGSADAITALHARVGAPGPDGTEVGWRTWHAYPQSGEMVETETAVMLR
ncbi:DUF2617 family protein [Micromonospora pattaloongensis]|uniref:DUF2617 family protein n=1 Tax=Micromonospora pattaloongensis TaxID=405436 RepID=UPI000B87391D|nr:DUF2617 family protein [Micromonospora pattaloongensis]